jgi:hypothetical protein
MGIPMAQVTKPKTKAESESAVQMNFRLTEYLRWRIYRFAQQEKIGQSEAVRRIINGFFEREDGDEDWRSKMK